MAAMDRAVASSRGSRWAARLLAVVLPAVLVGGWWAWIRLPAGGGAGGPSRAQERELCLKRPLTPPDGDLLIVGNSMAGENLDAARLDVGYPTPRGSGLLTIPGTSAPTWYTTLDEMVFARGKRPTTVVVAGGLPWLLADQVQQPRCRHYVSGYLRECHPDVGRKVAGGLGLGPAERWLWTRQLAREAVLSTIRDTSVGLLMGDGGAGSAREAGRRVMEMEASSALFDRGATDMDLHERVIPVVEEAGESSRGWLSDPIRASLVPDLLELCEGHGATLVIARIPVRGETAGGDPHTRTQERLARFVEKRGGVYLDLTGIGAEDAYWWDDQHLNAEGIRQLTDELADALGRERPAPR